MLNLLAAQCQLVQPRNTCSFQVLRVGCIEIGQQLMLRPYSFHLVRMALSNFDLLHRLWSQAPGSLLGTQQQKYLLKNYSHQSESFKAKPWWNLNPQACMCEYAWYNSNFKNKKFELESLKKVKATHATCLNFLYLRIQHVLDVHCAGQAHPKNDEKTAEDGLRWPWWMGTCPAEMGAGGA